MILNIFCRNRKDKSKIFLLKDEDLNECIGAIVDAACNEAFSMLKTSSSCVELFNYHNLNIILHFCDVDFQRLKVQEKAVTIENNCWLIVAISSIYHL